MAAVFQNVFYTIDFLTKPTPPMISKNVACVGGEELNFIVHNLYNHNLLIESNDYHILALR